MLGPAAPATGQAGVRRESGRRGGAPAGRGGGVPAVTRRPPIVRRSIVRIARFAKGDGVAYGVVEGESGEPQTIAELYGHPFGIDPAGVRFTGDRYPPAEGRLVCPLRS